MIRYISSLFPCGGQKEGAHYFRKVSPFQKCRGVALLAAVLAAAPATVLHFDVARRSVGGDLIVWFRETGWLCNTWCKK